MLPMSCPSEGTLLRRVFDQQVERLIEDGWPAALERTEKDFRAYLGGLADPPGGILREVRAETPDYLPFLVVIPHAILPIERQMERLVVAKKRGYASLDSGKLWNPEGIGEAKSPYLICDVDDGAENVGLATGEVAGGISRACRQGFIMEEAIALALHSPESLVHHAFALIGVDYQIAPWSGSGPRRQCVPELWNGSGGPTQNYSPLNSKREDRGVPSCKRRLFLNG